jgi:acyl carrier protein phosphodiesterase
LLSEDARKLVIENIEEAIETFKAWEKKWVEEELAKGKNVDDAISIKVARMVIALEISWQKAEKELLALETQFRKLVPVNEKRIVRKKK